MCFPSLGESCGNCYRCTDSGQAMKAMTEQPTGLMLEELKPRYAKKCGARLMKGNRWPDVCALCDTAIDLKLPGGWMGLHVYIGPGFVHGGGRENIPVHYGCIYLASLKGDEPVYASIVATLRR